MEPSYNAPHITPEQSPSLPPITPEMSPDVQTEQFERAPQPFEREPVPQQPVAMPDPQVAAPVLPAPVVDNITTDDAATLLTSLPDVAADDDMIEKEWVDKAKHIIAETSDDPHTRERAISQLQRDYLKKRYGKEVGAPE